jgi:hypothetical protein
MRTVFFNGIALGEISVSFIENPPKINAKAAFINTSTGQTHGWTLCHQWSAETVAKLKELRALMERDISVLHFADAGGSVIAASTTGGGGISETFKGLGETLGQVDGGAEQA